MPSASTSRDRILLVEDNPGDALLVRTALARGDRALEVDHVTQLDAANARLQELRYRAVILDLGLPDSRGVETLSRLHPVSDETPILVLTGQEEGKTRAEAMRRGAAGYLSKDRFDASTLVSLLERLLTGAPDLPESVSAAGWVTFVGESTARLNARLYHVAAWLEAAAGHVDKLGRLARPRPCEGAGTDVGAAAERLRLVAELGQEATKAIEAGREEIRDVMALATRVQRTLPDAPASTTCILGRALRRAGAILGSELAPAFEVRTCVDVQPQLPVDSRGLLSLVRRIVLAIRDASVSDGQMRNRLELSSRESNGDLVISCEASVVEIDEVDLRRSLETISGPPLCADRTDATRPVLGVVRQRATHTEVRVDFALVPAPEAAGDRPSTGSGLDDWWRAYDAVAAALREKGRVGAAEMATISRALSALEAMWPGFAEARNDLLDEVEARAPWLLEELRGARAAGIALRIGLHGLVAEVEQYLRSGPLDYASDCLAVDRLERKLATWMDDISADDERLARLLTDSMWRDLGTVD